jgi:serine/threonine protein kinase
VFRSDPKKAQRLHGDQDWIWQIAKSRIKFWPDKWLQSYKWEIRDRSELTHERGKRFFKQIKDVKMPNECSVCVFHGDPKPENILDPYVIDNWK